MAVTIMEKQKKLKTRVGMFKMFKNMGGNIPGGNFLGGNFPSGNSSRGSLMGGSFHDTEQMFLKREEETWYFCSHMVWNWVLYYIPGSHKNKKPLRNVISEFRANS